MKNSLQSIGLDQQTERAYRALLALGDAPASSIARRSGIKRTSIYHTLETLISMGLITSYKDCGVRRFIAEHPSKLKTFFERQMLLAERVLPDLEKEIRKSTSVPILRVFEGREAIKSMNEEALQAKEKMILSIGSTKKLLHFLGGSYGFSVRRRARGIFQRALRYRGDEPINSPARFHEVRFLQDSFSFPGYLIIFDNSVGIITFDEPMRGVLLKDRTYALMMRSMFQTLWDTAERD